MDGTNYRESRRKRDSERERRIGQMTEGHRDRDRARERDRQSKR